MTEYRCPTCYAAPDERCRTLDGRPATKRHKGHPSVATCDWFVGPGDERCGARVGERCRTATGRPATRPHAFSPERTCREAARVWADRQVREADEHRAFQDWARSRTRLVPPALAAAAALDDLDLPAGAPPEAIKRRWRELARTHHPDHGGDAERFKAARRSYEAAMAAAGATP